MGIEDRTSRIQEKKIEDERNDQRKKIEERLEKVSEPKARLVIDDKKGVILSDKDPKKKKPTLEESADGETEGITDAVDLAEAYELGEALKIMRDWLNFQSAHQGSTIAKDRANPASTIK